MTKECIWSKLDVKISKDKEGADKITDSSMGMFDRTILMIGIGSSRMNFIVMVCKYIQNVKISIQLTTFVKEYILVLNNRAIDLYSLM